MYRRSGQPENIGSGEVDNRQFNEPKFVFGACAGAAIYRKELFEDVGLFLFKYVPREGFLSMD
ncbi:hypothetical protein [Candidatus Oleimmundimicrobium sp.]|uniref:hypothetical protein n=1 Tax=Candidatus Oleimmundimicrobium sp. TaxID=3060597 RepID=UPI0027232609|nr:hypothetical protein [Candidatus Oleimmundimicrobium sp.]MDO8886938.1 hypothetical protein [Candidatus Oleimmundimicrobium sp.]